MAAQSNVFILQNYDPENLQAIINQLLGQFSSLSGKHFIIGQTWLKIHAAGIQSLTKIFLNLYRLLDLATNERETLLSLDDQLVILQLCSAEQNKQDQGDFNVEMSDVLFQHKIIQESKLLCQNLSSSNSPVFNLYQKFLKNSNVLDYEDLYIKVKTALNSPDCKLNQELNQTDIILISVPETKSELAMLKFLLEGKKICLVHIETDLNQSAPSIQSLEEITWEKITEYNFNSIKNIELPYSISEVYVKQILVSYLRLLFNSRDEIALARCINVPLRGLDHNAFTDLKHQAKQINMPMCQTAISFVVKFRLGGRGYAPDVSNPLVKHIKGLCEFVDMINKLHTIIEEQKDVSSALAIIIKVIIKKIMNSKDNKLKQSSIEMVTNEMQNLVAEVCEDLTHHEIIEKPEKSGITMVGHKTILTLRLLLDKLSCQNLPVKSGDILTDAFSSQKTPIRFPSLFSKFKSPDLEIESPNSKLNKSLVERVSETSVQPKKLQRVFSSCINEKETIQRDKTDTPRLIDSLFQTPVILPKLPSLSRKSSASQENNRRNSKPVKRSLLPDVGDETKKSKSKSIIKSKTKPLLKGQQRLTQFFRT